MHIGRIALAGVCLWLAGSAPAGGALRIDHPGIECIEPGRFAVVLSGIDPENDVQTAKVYFRSSLYPDFYYVEMTREGGRFVGNLPQVSPETPQVVYYLEAIDLVYESARSSEFRSDVDDCDDDPAAAYFPGSDPGIVVGATTAGGAALPPGFSALGIVGTITAAGVSSGAGGGIGASFVVAAAAGGAGAAAAVVATSQGDPSTTTVVGAAPPSTTVTTTSTSVAGAPPTATSTTTTTPPTTTISTTTVPAGGTTTIPGPSTTTVPSTSSSASSTTSSPSSSTTSAPPSSTTSSSSSSTTSSSTTTSAPPLNAGCFTVRLLEDCRVLLNAACVGQPVDSYDWVLDIDDRFATVTVSDGPVNLVHTWTDDECDEDGATLRFSLTVHRGAMTSSATKSLFVSGEDDLKAPPLETLRSLRMTALLELSSTGERGRAQIQLDGVAFSPAVSSGEPVELRVEAAAGTREVAAMILGGRGEPGLLRIDLSSTVEVVPGSLRATEGSVMTQGPRSLAFRLAGHPGERVRFTFELR